MLLAALQPDELLRVLWVASTQHAGAVAQLLLHGLSPAAAQLLTQRLEQADACFGGVDEVTADDKQQEEQQQQQQQGPAADQKGEAQQGNLQQPQQQQWKQQQAGGGAGGDELLQQVGVDGRDASACMPFSRAQFYAQLYGCVEDPGAVLAVMLAGKTKLAAAAAGLITRVHMGTAT
jgi:hypothetical protein